MKTDYICMAQVGFGLLTLVCLALILFGARKTFLKMGMNQQQTIKRTLVIGLVLFGWLGLVSGCRLPEF
jgi:4-amino-4-deoxy-L-arabinose transferase-like glycosyltransferase